MIHRQTDGGREGGRDGGREGEREGGREREIDQSERDTRFSYIF